jgi:hypothetical protein
LDLYKFLKHYKRAICPVFSGSYPKHVYREMNITDHDPY